MKNHKNFFSILFFAFLFTCAQAFYLYKTNLFEIPFIILLFRPVIVIIFAYCIYLLLKKHEFFKKANKFLYMAIVIWVFFSQASIFVGIYVVNYFLTNEIEYEKSYNDIADYKAVKKKIGCKKCIRHFPETIPSDAKNIKFYQYNNYWWGSQGIFLKFDTNAEYIEKELEKNKGYVAIIDNKTKNFYSSPRSNITFGDSDFQNISKYIFYIIYTNKKPSSFPEEYGLGIDYENKTILYYYHNPDD